MAITPTNSFATEIKLDGRTCLLADPAKYPAAAMKANSYRCPTGCDPGVAYVLMKRSDVEALNKNAALTLAWNVVDRSKRDEQGQIVPETTSNSFQRLYFVRAERLLRGSEGDGNAATLVELHDVRRILKQASAGNAQYNIRGVGLGQEFIEESRNSSADWTWETLIGDLWDKLPGSLAGSVPDLPYTPDGTPEGWKFIGESAWDAIHRVLGKLYMTTAYNPTDGTFSIVSLGAEQTLTVPKSGGGTEDVSVDDYAGTVTFNQEPVEGVAQRIPEKVRVWFPTWHDVFGANWDQAWDDDWEADRTAEYKEVATSAAGAVTGTLVDVWDDLSAKYNGSGDIQNDSALTTRATEVKNKWLQNAQVVERHKIIIGIDASVLPGSEIREVLWRNWGGRLGNSLTEFVTRPEKVKRLSRPRSIPGNKESIFNVTFTEDIDTTTEGQASFTFDDYSGGGIGVDVKDQWGNLIDGDTGMVSWMKNQWQIVHVDRCEALTDS